MSNEIKGLPGDRSIVGLDVYTDTAGNEGVAIVNADGEVESEADLFDLTTKEGQQAYLNRLMSLGIAASDLPEFVTNMETTGIVAGLLPAELASLKEIAAALAAVVKKGGGDTSGIQGKWADFIADRGVGNIMDVNALVQWVLREAYMENTKDLQFYAEKVRFYNELKKQIRDELTNARKFLSSTIEAAAAWAKGPPEREPEGFPLTYEGKEFFDIPVYDAKAGMVPRDPATSEITTKGELEAYIQGLEEKLNSVGDDAQLANVDLQNILQKQQQTLQMMSNISKMLHDTAMAIIRKIGG